ncbi:MAG TPA: 2-phospho-L-lactate guanylyltransferase [Candidatus Limnocylindria bacterium]
MTTRIIVPHRGLEHAKTRLGGVLDPAERAAVAERLLRHVLGAAVASGHEVVVISPDPGLEPLVSAAGARLTVQHGMGLNTGLAEARADAIGDGVTVLGVLHGDLPTLAVEEVEALLNAARGSDRPMVAIAPDAAETGTNGLALSPPAVIGFHFGPDSLVAHRKAAKRAGAWVTLVRRPGLAFDVDTPADLDAWVAGGRVA